MAKGFGKKAEDAGNERTPSENAGRRDAAADRLDSMRKDGFPEFSVWVRLTEEKASPDDPDFPWLPVGSLSVPRSGDIEKAIYDVEEDLMQGVYRLFPNMRGKEDDIEFGYQNKEFTDEDIQVANRPTAAQNIMRNLMANIPNPFSSNK